MQNDTEIVRFGVGYHDEFEGGGGLVVVEFIVAGSVGYETKGEVNGG